MHTEDFEKMIDNILIYYPLFFRRIKSTMNHESSLKYGRAEGYYQILGILFSLGPLPISVIGSQLYISKPNMTPLIDKLVNEGYVTRSRSNKDRRIINVKITNHGKNFLLEARKVVEENIKENLRNLDDNELKILYESLENIRKLSSKINHSGNHESL